MTLTRDSRQDSDNFTATVTSLTAVFGDATRRSIYLFIRDNPGATANELAQNCGVHANVARHHLERLVNTGYVVQTDKRSSGVGRPSKAYRVTDESLDVAGLGRRDALLVALLERALERLGPEAAEAMALEVGLEYGQRLADDIDPDDQGRSMQAALGTVADALTAHGFNAHADDVDGALVRENCPFGMAAAHHPVLCAVDRGLVAGMMEGLGAGTVQLVTLSSRARGDDNCRTTF